MRSIDGRAALAVGVRVQLSWVKYAPYTQRADLSVEDRLAEIHAREPDAWIAIDDTGERHRLEDDELAERDADPARGRWRIEGAIPTYRVGEQLQLRWMYRNRAPGQPARADRSATVIAEAARTVTVRLDDDTEIEMYRFGAQADQRDRSAPRWFVVARG